MPALLYPAIGGYQDAYTYIDRGHVFANAQTGNIVLFAVNICTRNISQALNHLPPIAAYGLGYVSVILMNEKFFKRPRQLRTAAPAIKLVVQCVLVVVGHSLSNIIVVPMISFVAAVQHTSFQSVGDWKFNSAMTTGNLRDATSGLTHWILGENVQDNREHFLILGSVCLLFMIGGLFTLHFPQ